MMLKRTLWFVAALALAATLTGLLAPNAAHSLVSALVTVGNTPAQPVPTVATDAQTAFVVSNYCYFNYNSSGSTGPSDNCQLNPFYSVPAGKTAVIESATGVCVLNAGTTMREFQVGYYGPGGGYAQLSLPPSPGIASPALSGFVVTSTAQNLKSYASGGASGTAINFVGWSSHFESLGTYAPYCWFTLSGYLVATP